MPVIGKENAPNRLRNFKNIGKDDVSLRTSSFNFNFKSFHFRSVAGRVF